MRGFDLSVWALVLLGGVGCGSEGAARPQVPTQGHFTIHEWGLIGLSTAQPTQASIATETPAALGLLGHGFGGGSGGKPVLYVHLDEGTDTARFDLELSVPTSKLIERWPVGGTLDATAQRTRAGWRSIVATRGPCASASPAPTPGSPLCTATRDHFCEAAEIPRYAGERASCLAVGNETSELLFYRADSIATASLPLRLEQDGTAWKVSRTGNASIEGPVFFIESAYQGAPVYIRRLVASDFGAALAPTTDTSITPSDVRAALLAEAARRGLHTSEADAFVDAWSPAFFDTCRRQGPVASGVAPTSLGQVGRSLIYFAPEPAVDAMLPLTTTPPARGMERVFLVRFVDPSSSFEQPAPGSMIGLGHGSGGSAPCTAHCPRIIPRDATVSTGLEVTVVRRVLQRSIGQLRFCYEQALRNRPELQGALTLEFTIRRDGSVGASRVLTSTLSDAAVERCFETAVRRFTFPTPEPARDVTVRLPFELAIFDPPSR